MIQPYFTKDIELIVEDILPIAQEFAGKTLLITGGQGFLGRYFAAVFSMLNKKVLTSPTKVVILDNQITSGFMGEEKVNDNNIQYIDYDVIKPFQYGHKFDGIIHCAGIASPHYYRKYPLETLDVAITGLRNALELAKQNQARLMFFSSSEIYGDPDSQNLPTKETYRGLVSSLGPRACYDESKRLGETLCRIYFTQFNVRTTIVRPFNVYGPGMQEMDYRVLPNFASRIKAGKSLRVYGHGRQTRTFCYVTDAMAGFLKVLAIGRPGEAFNIGNPTPEVSMFDLVGKIEKVLGRNLPLDIVNYPDDYPADEPNRRCPDISKAMQELSYHPKMNLDQGLGLFFEWTNSVYKGY